MKKIKLFCVAPYEGMKDLMQNIAARREDVEMIIRVGDLCSGTELASEDVGSDVDAIISRGGTAEILKSKFRIPTIEIMVSVYDVLRAIRMARNISSNFAVVGFPSVANAARSLCEMLQYNIPVFTVRGSKDAKEQMQQLKEQGFDLVVGDTITVKVAEDHGINGILFTSGIEGIEDAVNSAVQLCRYHAELKSTIHLLSQVISSDNRKVVVYDSNARQCYSTLPSLPDELSGLLQHHVPRIISGDSYNTFRPLNGHHVLIQGQNVKYAEENYCMYEFRDAEFSKQFFKQGIRYMNAEKLTEQESPEYYLGGSETINSIMNTVNRYCALQAPVLINGETGCGMDAFAAYIFRRSPLKHCAYIIVDCSLMSKSSWEFMLSSNNSPLCEKNLTVYFKNLECATQEQQASIEAYLKDSLVARRNRLIFSYTVSGGETLLQNDLYRHILESMGSFVLHLPPLRSHKEDIPVLVGLAINANNLLMGTQTIGLMPEAMQYLQEYPWEHNVDQLRHTVRELVSSATSPYIPLRDVQSLLQSQRSGLPWRGTSAGIDLNRTLDEITQDIIFAVFQEEKMNQSQTAKRLGISRSTLWRLMKRNDA